MSSNNEDQRKAAARNAEQAMMKVGAATAATIDTLAKKDPLLSFIKETFEAYVPGISPVGLLQAMIACTTVLVGPVHGELITSVREDGTQSSWAQPIGDFFMFVSGPGQFKSGTMTIALEALLSTLRAIDGLKHSLGGLLPLHRWVDHIDRNLSIFRDASTSAWYDRIKANPKIMTLAYFIDEFDVVLKRVKCDKSSGELGSWLSLWNVGGPLCKNTGQINVGIHHVFSVAMACGQYFAAYDLGCDEDSAGRGFAPRWIFAAGHLTDRKWPFSKDVDYVKLLLARMVSGIGNLGKSRETLAAGSVEHVQNKLVQLMSATLVMLHTFPTATVRALEPAQRFMRQTIVAAREAARVHGESSGGRAYTEPSSPMGMSTPQIATRLGFDLESPTEASSSGELSSQSPDESGKRKAASSYGSEKDNSKPKANPPTKEESDATWKEKSIRMFFTAEAQDIVAQFLTNMEAKERDAGRTPGQQSLAAYFRKAKDHLMRLLPIVHLIHLGLHLLDASGFDGSHTYRPRHMLRLVEVATSLPHVENRYIALGGAVNDAMMDSQCSQDSCNSEEPPAANDRAIGHLIGEAAVHTTVFILSEHLKLVAAIHSVSQSRCAPMLNMPGFFVTSTDAHTTLNMSVDAFVDLAKMAQRAGTGVLVTIEPVRWKGNKGVPFATGAELSKTGGHAIQVFVKHCPPDGTADATKLRLSAALTRCGTSLNAFKASLTQNIVDSAGGTVTKAMLTRMQQLPKMLLGMAFAAKRTDLILPRDDGLSWVAAVQAIHDDASKPTFWADESRLREAHEHLLQLAVLVHNDKPKEKDMPSIEALPSPFLPPPPASVSRPHLPPSADADADAQAAEAEAAAEAMAGEEAAAV